MPDPIADSRHPDHPIDPMFVGRWSPRAFSGEEIAVADLMSMFEAARWSPSSYNSQPWRFAWARRGTPAFDGFLALLTGMNPQWCADAAALVFVASSETMAMPGKPDPVPSISHSFDAGSAWMSFALQAHMMGWSTHGMVGLNYGEAATKLNLPLGFKLEMAIAVGRIGDPAKLPDALRAREMPNGRKPIAETVSEGASGRDRPRAVRRRGGPRPVVVSVCVSCRAPGGPDEARPGADLLATLQGLASGEPGLSVRPVQCLSVCKRPCTVALSGPGRYTYVFGDVDPATGAADVLACGRTYAERPHGYMLWRERPENLRRGTIARIPPPGWAPDDGGHPG